MSLIRPWTSILATPEVAEGRRPVRVIQYGAGSFDCALLQYEDVPDEVLDLVLVDVEQLEEQFDEDVVDGIELALIVAGGGGESMVVWDDGEWQVAS